MLQCFPINNLDLSCLSVFVLVLLIFYSFYSSNTAEIFGNFSLALTVSEKGNLSHFCTEEMLNEVQLRHTALLTQLVFFL